MAGLTFAEETEFMGATQTHELVEGGATRAVTEVSWGLGAVCVGQA